LEDVNRVCLLTGGSGLLGGAFIERYAARYRIVAVHHRSAIPFATQEQQFVDPLFPSREIDANRNAVYAIRADIASFDEIDRVVSEALSRFRRVDLLINGAAVRSWSPLLAAGALDTAETSWQVNVLAPLRFSVALAQRFWCFEPSENLRFNRNIVNISSTAGLFVYPDLGQALYGTSKAALNHLTYHLASELWDIGIRANAVAPDTFPGRVSKESVLDTIVRLDDSEQTGHIVRLCQESPVPALPE
jgi:NAD(P)-dependent dehydrogenase (short-subunit alcohol dehydrogenase family)